MQYRIGVVGATGNVGREMLNILHERNFPYSEVHAIASRRSMGTEVSFGDKTLKCQDIEQFDFSKVDLVLMSAGSTVAKEWAPKIGQMGVMVIDNSSFWRYDSRVPLIVPEVNPEAINDAQNMHIIANPNCSTAQLVVALKPLHDVAKIKRVVVSTYQSVSGGGKDAMDELFTQSRAVFVADPIESHFFTKRIAFNVIPHIDEFMKDGYTKEEWKVLAETKKMLDKNIAVTCTAVRVPVFIGHAESVNIEFETPLSEEEARKCLEAAPGILVTDRREDAGYVTPYDCAGEDNVFVSRIRQDITVEHGLNMWVVADNLRKGAALNSVQIAELCVQKNILTSNG